MARGRGRGGRGFGGRRGGIGRHRFGHGGFHHSHPHYGRQRNGIQQFQIECDQIAQRTNPPQFLTNTLFISGNEGRVLTQLDNFNSIQPTFYVDPWQMMEQQLGQVGQQLEMAVMGNHNTTEGANNYEGAFNNEAFLPGSMPNSLPGQEVTMGQMGVDPHSMMNPYPQQQGLMAQMMQPQQPQQMPTTFNQVDITVVGTKVSAYNSCCYILTILLGAFLILPLFVMCCGWWNKLVYPKYQLGVQFYRALGRFLRNNRTVTTLAVNVIDNSLNDEKIREMYQSLEGSSVQTFTFVNRALACNHNANEADSFLVSMGAIKALPMTTTATWGDMTI